MLLLFYKDLTSCSTSAYMLYSHPLCVSRENTDHLQGLLLTPLRPARNAPAAGFPGHSHYVTTTGLSRILHSSPESRFTACRFLEGTIIRVKVKGFSKGSGPPKSPPNHPPRSSKPATVLAPTKCSRVNNAAHQMALANRVIWWTPSLLVNLSPAKLAKLD